MPSRVPSGYTPMLYDSTRALSLTLAFFTQQLLLAVWAEALYTHAKIAKRHGLNERALQLKILARACSLYHVSQTLLTSPFLSLR